MAAVLAPPSPVAPNWTDEARLARTVSWTAAALSLLVSLTVPLGYFWLSYDAQAKESAVAARLHAAFVIQAIGNQAGHWQDDVAGLIEADLAPADVPEQRRIRDLRGQVIATSGPPPASPVLRVAAPLATYDGVVGEVQVVRSLEPIVWRTAGVSLLSVALGAAIFLTLRTLPLRALRRTLEALRREESKAREEAESTLRVVFEHAVEGILLFDEQGHITLCNPAAARMFGVGMASVLASPVTTWLHLDLSDERLGHDPVETVGHRRQQKDFPAEVAISLAHIGGRSIRIAVVRDITERKLHEERLLHLANFDSLTGLPNRSLFRERLEQAMARARRHGRTLALMFLDLDRFKTINDSLGHEFGDKLLIAVARLLGGCLRATDTVGVPVAATAQDVFRLGGDEFTVLVEDLDEPTDATVVARRILKAFERPLLIDGEELFISTSIGITLYPQDDADLDGLVRQADMAMYRSKALGRDTFFFYDQALNEQATARHLLEAALRHALDRGEFHLVYQPKADLRSGCVTGVEALLRWSRAGLAPIGPDTFVPILEETGLIAPVGQWVMREACEQMMRWRQQGLPPMQLAINLSARQFRQQDLLQQLEAVLRETGFEPERLEVELTESMLIEDSEAVLQIMARLGQMGVRVAIDDFGTGHSSLSYLKRFNLDTLKIDRSFVRDTPDDAEDCAITVAVIALAHSLHLKVVAEGVETPAQLKFLRQQGCDEMQGYLLSRPLAAPALAEWLQARERPADADGGDIAVAREASPTV